MLDMRPLGNLGPQASKWLLLNWSFFPDQVTFELGSNDNLGLMIRGGIEYGLGIFITGVEPQSAAHRHGLRVSD